MTDDIDRTLRLPRDADWSFEIVIPTDQPALDPSSVLQWRFGDPDGDGLPMFIGSTSSDGRLISWDEDVVDVRAVLATKPRHARLHYVLGEADHLWDVWRVRGV